jgi:zinc transporter
MTTSVSSAGMEPGLRFAMLIAPNGSTSEQGWEDLKTWKPDDGFLWIHLERDHPTSQAWLMERSGLDPVIAQALADDESRPRVEDVDDALLVVLRGVNNLNIGNAHGCEPDTDVELVPLHIWIEGSRCITLRDKDHSLEALHDLRVLLLSGKGPRDAGAILARIAEKVVDHLGDLVSNLEEELSELEDQISSNQAKTETRHEVTELRRRIVLFRRYMSPQREALYRLRHDDATWLHEDAKLRLREVNDRLSRHLDNLDEMRQRSTLLHEELDAKTAEMINRNTFMMSIVSVIMLPITFITGFFGMNTGGLPYNSEDPNGTLTAGLIIVVVGALTVAGLVYLLRRR